MRLRAARPSAVLFDLDGTLVDSLPTLSAIMNAMLGEMGRSTLPPQTLRGFVGDGPARLVERALAATGGASAQESGRAAAEFLRRYEEAPTVGTVLFPGVEACLEALREMDLALAVCTNKPQKVSHLLLEGLGVAGHFGAIIGGDSCPSRKPSPEPALEACRRLGVASAEAWFVGDNEHDVACGTAAGCAMTVLVSYGYLRLPPEELRPGRRIDNMSELTPMLEAVE